MLRIKRDLICPIRLKDMSSQIATAAQIATGVYWRAGGFDTIISSCNDGVHMTGSKHYQGRAIDLSIKDVPHDDRFDIFTSLCMALGNAPPGDDVFTSRGLDFDVLWEYRGTAKEHLHCEYDPKP